MNSTTEEQRAEVVYALYKAWEARRVETGEDVSLCVLLKIPGTETELIENLNGHTAEAEHYKWVNFNELEIELERAEKYTDALSKNKAWAKIAETYNMNSADRQHCRYMLEDDVTARVNKLAEKAKASRTIEVLEALVDELKYQANKSDCAG